jgi:threonine dehydratase
MDHIVPTFEDVAAASIRLMHWLRETPVLESGLLNKRVGARVLVKAECLQYTGSFKIRGALNRMLKLGGEQRAAGVVAFSSGNHAFAVAQAARWLSVPATVVMPGDAPQVKLEGVRRLGGEVVLYDRRSEDREEIAARLAAASGAALVPPFEHADVVAGQGTIGLELAAAARDLKLELDAVYVPCSGGGLLSGAGIAIRQSFPGCKLVAVEPRGYDDTGRSLAAGKRQLNNGHPESLCDGLLAATPGVIAFTLLKQMAARAATVDDTEVLAAMAFAADELKLVVEPSGAAGLAALLRDRPAGHDCIGVVLSGGNVDSFTLHRAMGGAPKQ